MLLFKATDNMNMQWLAVVTGAPIVAQEALTCMVRLMESGIERHTFISGEHLQLNVWGCFKMHNFLRIQVYDVTKGLLFPRGYYSWLPSEDSYSSWYRKIDISIVTMIFPVNSTRFWKALKDGIRKLGLRIADYVRLIATLAT